MYSQGDIFLAVYSGFSSGLLLLCYLYLFSEKFKAALYHLLPCPRVVWQYHTHKQMQRLFSLYFPLILPPPFHSMFCFYSVHMSLYFQVNAFILLSTFFLPLSVTLALSLPVCQSLCQTVAVGGLSTGKAN